MRYFSRNHETEGAMTEGAAEGATAAVAAKNTVINNNVLILVLLSGIERCTLVCVLVHLLAATLN